MHLSRSLAAAAMAVAVSTVPAPTHASAQGTTAPPPQAAATIEKTSGGDIFISLNHVNTLDGFETIDGVECARIKIESRGTLKGNLEEGGASLTLDGTMAASATWHFAIKQGGGRQGRRQRHA